MRNVDVTYPLRQGEGYGGAVVSVERATQATDELADALARLVPQLSGSASPPTREELAAMVASPDTRLLVARDDVGAIVGTLTLVCFRIPTGVRARIEDVVVDAGARGQGVGEALSRAAIRLAREAGARTVDLTSRPERAKANRLYRRLGFEPRETSVLRYTIT
jgi:ribosomal protein S18 acetylase RimI-like enzyme